jgi:hypothetical protein
MQARRYEQALGRVLELADIIRVSARNITALVDGSLRTPNGPLAIGQALDRGLMTRRGRLLRVRN